MILHGVTVDYKRLQVANFTALTVQRQQLRKTGLAKFTRFFGEPNERGHPNVNKPKLSQSTRNPLQRFHSIIIGTAAMIAGAGNFDAGSAG